MFEIESSPNFQLVDPLQGVIDELGGAPKKITPTSEAGGFALKLVDARRALNELRKQQAKETDELSQLNIRKEEAKAAYRRAIAEIEELEKPLKESIYDRRRAIAQAQRNVETLERQLRLALDKIRAGDKFQKMAEQLDADTIGAPWREWAFDKQIECAKIVAINKRVLCGNKVGTGKSLTALIAADMLKVKRLLIVTPADVTRNFEREVARWAPHRPLLSLYKQPKLARQLLLQIAAQTSEYTVTVNYEAWRRDASLIQDLINLKFEMVILDESHNVKNTKTSAFDGIKAIVHAENCCPRCSAEVEQRPNPMRERSYFYACTVCKWDSMSDRDYKKLDRCSVKYLMPMTGTPILNRPQELYPLLHLMMPDVFDKEYRFLDLYCVQDPNTGYWTWNSGGLQRLQHHLAGYYIAYTKEDMGIKTPLQSKVVHEIDFDKEAYPNQWRIIEQLTKHAQILLKSGKEMKAIATIALITRKRQANVYPAGISLKDEEGNVIFTVGEEVNESIKVDKIIEMVTNELSGERTVVFSQFKAGMREAARRLNEMGVSAVVFDGETPEHTRDAIKIDFDRTYCDKPDYQKKWQVVLCNYKTGGVGLNFTGATQTIIMDEEWNPGKNEQAYGRTDRIGQTQESTVHILRINNSIDTWMAALNDHKAKVVGGFETATAGLATSLLEAMDSGEII
jgi:SNF2 family DNA or RNA helicase